MQVEKEMHGRKFCRMGPETLYFLIILQVISTSLIRTGLDACFLNTRHRLVGQEFPEEVVNITVMDGCLDSEGISRVATLAKMVA